MQLGPRILLSTAAGLGSGGLIYAAVRKWNLTGNRREEAGLFAGLAVALVVFLLLADQTVPAETGTSTSESPAQPVVIPPLVIGPPNLNFTPSKPQTTGNCDCGCGATNSVLNDAFNKLGAQFANALGQEQLDYYSALMASVPDWLSQYQNNPLGVQQSVMTGDLFSSTVTHKPDVVYFGKVMGAA